jgi:hypothetical protein
MVLTVE